ncbi:caspase family protein (plasmid) [Ensifer adhaerens]|uniref:caspase family protein n=1 Tax=Ensifer adhaerens TaxID=106592 RepID=UPI001CBE4D25|nr:caspase family protein [Ensifer adhaerens]MBZ7927621.1 caspase family protein [Ensifer adhaerens]UAX98022.1 caspase family protein [Ensifer adhaerens]UAY05402.1 caspase family protein [Ensifer adhaerens]UAY12780.1 caspase family protein [Ensifer adhaerens]
MQWRAKLRSWILSVPMLLLVVGHGFAEENGKRLALVVGMANYVAAGTLPNAARDAEAFGTFLKGQGFETDLVLDADRRGLAGALSNFSRKIGPDDVALFYYAGHGMQLHGENFLIGTDAKLESEFDVPAETIALSEIINALEKRARISMVFLDACRNNPLANRLNTEVEGATRGGATRGLAPIETQGAGTLVAFAAAPGQVAADGTDGHSPFTRALIANLSGAGLEVGTAFKRVVRDVRKETQGKQQPQILSSLSLEFYFGPETAAPQTPTVQPVQPALAVQAPATDPVDPEVEVDFKKALRIGTPRIWRFFLEKHRTGEYAELGRRTLAQIEPASVRNQSHLPQSVEARLLPDKEQRRNVQLALAAKGFATGVPDGVFGGQTREAIKSYQRSKGEGGSGFITERTAESLGIKVNLAADGIYSSATARTYDIKDLTGLETDERVLAAVRCTSYEPSVYGAFGGHFYVAVRTGPSLASYAEIVAKRCGARLASITSEAENAFVASLFNSDPNFFDMGFYVPDKISYKVGPWIGLVQDPQGKEPRGGWHWNNGEAMTYSKWWSGGPNEFKPGNDLAMYYTQRDGRLDMKSTFVNTWHDMGTKNTSPSLVLEFE